MNAHPRRRSAFLAGVAGIFAIAALQACQSFSTASASDAIAAGPGISGARPSNRTATRRSRPEV